MDKEKLGRGGGGIEVRGKMVFRGEEEEHLEREEEHLEREEGHL